MAITSKNSYSGSDKKTLWGRSSVFKGDLDTGFVLLIFLMFGVGLVQVYSSSFILATETRTEGLFFVKRQLLFTFIALAAFLGFAHIPWKWVKTIGLGLWGVSILGILVTLIPGVGHTAGGAARWISLGPIKFEPSELLKVTAPLIVAAVFNWKFHSEKVWDLVIKALILALPLPLLLHQPDFGTFTIYTLVVFTLFFIFGLKWRYIIAATIIALPTFYFLVISKPYRRARLMAFLDPWSDPAKSGFQVIQSMLSFSSGGISGVGLGQGQGKLFFLPESHTDFTLAVLGEELGYIGFFLLLSVYAVIIIRGFRVGARANDPFARCVALGLIILFSFQVFTNVGVVLGLLPTKGLTLPFLSYGGSSLVVMGILFGILLNIDRTFHLRSGN